MIKGLDADTILTPYAADIAASGIGAVGRYLKNLQAAEIVALHTAGIAIWLIFEAGAENVLGGAAQGTLDGQRALGQAQALGAPSSAAIYATADTDITDDQVATATDYWAAFDAVIFGHYQIGGYADGTALSELRQHGLPYTWLAGAMGWQGSYNFLANGNPTMVQTPTFDQETEWPTNQIILKGLGLSAPIQWPDLGFPYDGDVIMADDYGAWKPST